jgi:hypothetical protein
MALSSAVVLIDLIGSRSPELAEAVKAKTTTYMT